MELGPTLQEALNFLRSTLPSTIELVTSVDPNTPHVLADPTQIYQVIANLCTNASHALEGRPGRIEIRIDPVALSAAESERLGGVKPGNFACLSVIDSGKGMDEATRQRIFDPFFTTKDKGKGTGLGLSVVHGIVRGHDGAVSVNSELDRGTTFRVYFPATTARTPVAEPPAHKPRRGQGQHIFILDDEEALVFLAQRMLGRLGYRVTGFTSVTEALSAFRENPDQFDLAVTDLNMPGASGIQVATELMKIRPAIPVVLASGYVTEELRQRARDIGIREVITKPNTMEEFSHSIQRLMTGAPV
jgi:CheY-like chemotaxis protein